MKSERGLHSVLLMGVLGVLLVVAILTWPHVITDILVPCPMASSRPSVPGSAVAGLEVWITSPEDCSFNIPTGVQVPIEGRYNGNTTGREIWVLLYASDHKYYLQQPPELDPNKKGHWTGSFLDMTVEKIDIVVVVTNENSEASQDFWGWLEAKGSQGGYSVLPDGITEMHAITVSTYNLRQ